MFWKIYKDGCREDKLLKVVTSVTEALEFLKDLYKKDYGVYPSFCDSEISDENSKLVYFYVGDYHATCL